MPIPPGLQTAAMIAGTMLAAAGLNLGVLSLDDPDSSTASDTGPADVAAAGATAGSTPLSTEPVPVEVRAPAPSAGAPAVTAPTTGRTDGGPRSPVTSVAGGIVPEAGPSSIRPAPVPSRAPAADPPTTLPEITPPPTTPAPQSAAPQTTVSQTTVPQTAVARSEAPSTPADGTATPTSAAVETEYLTYDFIGVATIVIARHQGDRLEFWSATKSPGWVHRVDDDGPDKVKVTFQRLSDGEEAEFEVKLDGGGLDVKMED